MYRIVCVKFSSAFEQSQSCSQIIRLPVKFVFWKDNCLKIIWGSDIAQRGQKLVAHSGF